VLRVALRGCLCHLVFMESDMSLTRPCGNLLSAIAISGALCVVSSSASAQNPRSRSAQTKDHTCPQDDSGLQLPAGFCATVFADDIGHARHLVGAPNGVVYVNTWSGRYYGNDTPHAGGFLVALQDTTGSGKADVNQRFGETVQSGGAGGTGIGMYGGAIYAEINDKIVRYRVSAGSIVPQDTPATIVPDCRSAVTILCTRSLSTPTGPCTSTSLLQPMPASFKIARRNRLALTLARSSRRAVVSGGMTRIRRTRHFHRRSALPPAYATQKASQ